MRIMDRKGALLTMLVLAAALFALTAARRGDDLAKQALWRGNPDLVKLSGELLALHDGPLPRSLERFRWARSAPERHDPLVEVEVRFHGSSPEAVRRDLEDAGFRLAKLHWDYSTAVGRIPVSRLDEVAGLDFVVSIRRNRRPLTQGFAFGDSSQDTGRCLSQADGASGARRVRAQFGVSGKGVKVGVISDSFRGRLAGAVADGGDDCTRVFLDSEPQNTGELPDSIFLVDDGRLGQTDEGRALAELIHDLAPGAEIYFHTGSESMTGFAKAIDELGGSDDADEALEEPAGCGVDVIVDDLLYIEEPMFQDGIIARRAQAAVDRGIAYFTAAGNQWDIGIDQVYLDWRRGENREIPPNGFDFHQFATGDGYASMTLPPGCGVQVALQWNESFADGPETGAASDLDLYLCTSRNPEDCVYGSASAQGCGAGRERFGDPMEIIGPIVNPRSSPQTLYLAVDHFCGNSDVRFRIVTFPVGCSTREPGNPQLLLELDPCVFGRRSEECDRGDMNEPRPEPAPQIYGHAAGSGVISVAAVHYLEVAFEGTVTPPVGPPPEADPSSPPPINVEPFSSQGGSIPIYFDPANAPEIRLKPDISAVDGTDTSFFSQITGDFDNTRCPNFEGTSAAAAHAAAIGTLLLEIQPDLDPELMQQCLANSGRVVADGPPLIDAVEAAKCAAGFLAAPKSLSQHVSGSGALLQWEPVEGASHYLVQRQHDSPSGEKTSQEVDETSLFLIAPSAVRLHRWRVAAVEESGRGLWSDWRTVQLRGQSWQGRRRRGQ